MAFAGIWEGWRAPDGTILRSFAIITTAANLAMREIHERMPVILEKEDWQLWLDGPADEAFGLLHASAEDVLRLWPIDKRVGNVRNDDPDLLTPIPNPLL